MDPETTTANTDLIRMYVDTLWPVAAGALLALITLIIGWIGSRWAHHMVVAGTRRARLDVALGEFLGQLARYTVIAAALIAALGRLGIETTSLAVVFGSAGLAVGMALSGSLANFAAGVMILFFRPFVLGDRIKAAGELGDVMAIGLFATTMKTADNQTIIVPNAAITGGNITNVTAAGTLRASLSVGVAYGADVARVRQVLLDAAGRIEGVLADPAPAVAFVGLGASALDFKVHIWSLAADTLAVQDRGHQAIYDALNAAGIEIPFTQVVVHQAAG